jgi:putative endonuclease
MLRCGDGSLYVGISNALLDRLAAHRAGKGARYTRSRGPLELVWVEHAGEKGDALRRELALKKLDRKWKLVLAGLAPPPARRRRGASS